MTVELYDAPDRYIVEGQEVEGYLVDLGENDGNGKCGCFHFEYRIQPRLDRAEKPGEWSRCKHIAAVLRQRQRKDNDSEKVASKAQKPK